MTTGATSRCRWSAKWYIVAALAGTLLLTIIVIIVSVVLSPPEIRFSVTDASSSGPPTGSAGARGLDLTVTVAVNSTSHRAAGVKYQSVRVSLLYNSSATNTNSDRSLPLDQVSYPPSQPPRSTARINLSASFPPALWASDFASNNGTPIGVLLDSVVRFKYGRLYTRSYEVSVLCNRADYFNRSRITLPINCYDY